MVVCEKVTIKNSSDETFEYVQYYTPDDLNDRDIALAHLRSCGYEVSVEVAEIQGQDGEPCVSWGDLSDIYVG